MIQYDRQFDIAKPIWPAFNEITIKNEVLYEKKSMPSGDLAIEA
jgi:hypothetical protein